MLELIKEKIKSVFLIKEIKMHIVEFLSTRLSEIN